MMDHVLQRLANLPERHRAALSWFLERSGTTQPWPAPLQTSDGETLLAGKAKGIYKPAWSEYALSVRQTLNGPYADLDPKFRDDGSWLYPYFQENRQPGSGEDEFTNRGLMACWRDQVPIGVIRQVSGKPNSRYDVLGLALVCGRDGGYFLLEGFGAAPRPISRGSDAEIEFLYLLEQQQWLLKNPFDPSGLMDARERVVAQIARRRGQPEFRKNLLVAYERRCAMSDCDAEPALEAAHITPFLGDATNRIDNGLLLRGDLHTLFDVGLISIDADSLSILLAPQLVDTSYVNLAGTKLRLPRHPRFHPSAAALRVHRDWTGL